MRRVVLLFLCSLALAGCESKAHQVQRLQEQYNAAYAAYSKNCSTDDSSGAARLLTGEKLTDERIAALEAKKKVQEARCKPKADRLADMQRQILAAQQ